MSSPSPAIRSNLHHQLLMINISLLRQYDEISRYRQEFSMSPSPSLEFYKRRMRIRFNASSLHLQRGYRPHNQLKAVLKFIQSTHLVLSQSKSLHCMIYYNNISNTIMIIIDYQINAPFTFSNNTHGTIDIHHQNQCLM